MVRQMDNPVPWTSPLRVEKPSGSSAMAFSPTTRQRIAYIAEGHPLILFPVSLMQRDVGTFAEHAHRLWGLLVGLTTIVLMARLWMTEPRVWPRWLSAGVVVAVVGQGVLGGTRVTEQSVHLAVPNRLHHDMARRALEAGKHVMCEKPLAMDATESADLVAVAARSGLQAGVCYNVRFYPLNLEARD